MLDKKLQSIDTNNHNIMKSITSVEPKYAKHMFLKNSVIENFAMHSAGGLDILEQPVCPACEKPAAWDVNSTGYCFSCNRSISADKVITVLEYLLEHTNMFSEEQLERLNLLGGGAGEIIK